MFYKYKILKIIDGQTFVNGLKNNEQKKFFFFVQKIIVSIIAKEEVICNLLLYDLIPLMTISLGRPLLG